MALLRPPYRDETETLRADNARLHAELARRRRGGRGLSVLLVVIDFGAIVVLRPWLNGGSDVQFWCGVALVAAIAAAAVTSAIGVRR